MRLTTPRVLPAAGEGWTEEQREIVEPMLARGPVLNNLPHPSDPSPGGQGLPRLGRLYPRPQEHIATARARDRHPSHRLPLPLRL